MKAINTILNQSRNKEASIQTAIVVYLTLMHITVFYIPNETNIKNPITRAIKKKMGLRSGVSDLCILLKNGRTIFIEVKTEKGKQTANQKDWQQTIEEIGYEYYIWRSVDDAIEFIESLK